ncbi:hypothetical protein [Haloimpatiens lingqiaonensis]|uniref:hypothetical protein n=1 Tax=Haloimpatiens lingqiaonensis TaxID=1380675 RepID=UPI0010FD2D35|nr:hypothetical protein [Haloimpatiens lingqiaonensis]
MSQYFLNIIGKMQLRDYSNIYDYMQFVGNKDELVISINSKDNIDSDIICTMLKDNNFNVIYEGGKKNEEYHIKAHRN